LMLWYQFFGKFENDFGAKLLMRPVYASLSETMLSLLMSTKEPSLREVYWKLESWLFASSSWEYWILFSWFCNGAILTSVKLTPSF
jgi:hypothetical protein